MTRFDSKSLTGLIFTYFVILVLAMFFLFATSVCIQSYWWSGSLPEGEHWDAWSVRVYPEFFIYYPLTLGFFIIAMVSYPILISILTKKKNLISSTKMNFVILIGLFLPTEFVFGDPHILTYSLEDLGPILYTIWAPAYRFTIGWQGGFTPGPVAVGMLYISVVLCLFLYKYEMIDYQAFLMPIIITLIFIIVGLIQNVHVLLTATLSFPTLQLSAPSIVLGILIHGQEIRDGRRLSN